MEAQSTQDDESDNGATLVMEQPAQRDLKRVLRLVREGKLRVGDKTGLASAASMKLIKEVVTG